MTVELSTEDEVRGALESAMRNHSSGRLQEARDEYQRVISVVPAHADALHLCGMACYQLGDASSAEDLIRKAIQIKPDHCDYHSNLGVVLKANGELREAISAFSMALTMKSDFPDCLNNLASTYVALGQDSDAEDVYRRLVESHPEHAGGCNNLAVLLAADNRLDEAGVFYERALASVPEYADAHANYGRMLGRLDDNKNAIAHLRKAVEFGDTSPATQCDLCNVLINDGAIDEALTICDRVLASTPDSAVAHVTIGNAYQAHGDSDNAEKHYRTALDVEPSNARAINNLGTLFMQQGDEFRALECFLSALDSDPDFVEALFNAGTASQQLGRAEDAENYYKEALARRPKLPKACRYLAEIYRSSGRREHQVEVLRHWLEQCPTSASAQHLLAAAEQGQVPARASDDYIREEFDEFADAFEETLEKLEYRTPELLGRLVKEHVPVNGAEMAVLDAGCGTGLCAPFLQPISTKLTGVDLSEKMLERAAARGVYDDLSHSELVAFMNDNPQSYNLIVSADTLVYFGALDPVCMAAAVALQHGGYLAFSVEHLADEDAEEYRLNTSGRYRHTEAGVRRCMTAAGFSIDAIQSATLRLESKQAVAGLLVIGHIG